MGYPFLFCGSGRFPLHLYYSIYFVKNKQFFKKISKFFNNDEQSVKLKNTIDTQGKIW